jgi:filamentous hemagglutinin family protein
MTINTQHTIQRSRAPSRLTALTLALIATLPMLQQAAYAQPGLVVDPNAAQQPTLSIVNGTPVVNIVAPNGSGISHNTFTDFNVGQAGLILNNSSAGTQTTLGGAITGNHLLNGNSAGVILNEVTGRAASRLNGKIEVAGPSARVIVANPNGITANGAGFINANRVSLVAGKAVFDESGNLSRLRTENGQIRIEGAGLDASGANEVDLVARTLQVNAQLQAKKLNAAALKGEVDAADPTIVTETGIADSPSEIAIDVAQLGSMHADSIRLVGKSAGVGVNVDGKVKALTGSLSVSSDGKVMIASTGELEAKQALSVAGGMHNKGMVKGANVSVAGSSVQSEKASLLASGSLSVAGEFNNSGEVRSGGSMSYAGNLENHGTVRSGGSMSIAAGQVVNDKVIHSDNTMSLTGGSLRNDQAGSITSAGRFTSVVGSRMNQGVMGGGFQQPPTKPSAPVSVTPNVTPEAVAGSASSDAVPAPQQNIANAKPSGSTIAQNQVPSISPPMSYPSFGFAPVQWQAPVVTYPVFNWSGYQPVVYQSTAAWKQPSYQFAQQRYW